MESYSSVFMIELSLGLKVPLKNFLEPMLWLICHLSRQCPLWVLVRVTAAPLLIQCPAHVSGKATKGDLNSWTPAPTWETCMALQPPGLSLIQAISPFGVWTKDSYSLFLHPSLLSLSLSPFFFSPLSHLPPRLCLYLCYWNKLINLSKQAKCTSSVLAWILYKWSLLFQKQ